MKCKCKIRFINEQMTIVYCQMHRHAPDLLEICKELRGLLEDWWKAAGSPPHSTEIALSNADNAINKAEERDEG